MDIWQVATAAAGAVATIGVFLLQRLYGRIDRTDTQISEVRIEIARQQQENKELQTHIHRIDKNLDDLFKKIEEILFQVRKNGSK